MEDREEPGVAGVGRLRLPCLLLLDSKSLILMWTFKTFAALRATHHSIGKVVSASEVCEILSHRGGSMAVSFWRRLVKTDATTTSTSVSGP